MSSVKTMRANAVLVFNNSVFADELEIKPVLCPVCRGCFLQFDSTCEKWSSDKSMIHNYIHTQYK